MVGFEDDTLFNVRVGADETVSRDALLVPGPVSKQSIDITADKEMVNSMSTSGQKIIAPATGENNGNVSNAIVQPRPRAFTNGLNSGHPIPQPGRIVYQYQYRQNTNTEEYQAYAENDYLHVNRDPLSTFSIDVDGGSYSNVRRFINQATLPPPDAVRTQELINYFAYDYPQPTHGDPISVTTEIAACPWNPKHQIALIGLQARKVSTDDMPASNLVFLLDVSGSMAEPNKLPLVKSAFHILVDHLRSEDRVSIVTYAGNAQTALYPTPGDQKERILEAIDGLYASGSTNGGEGLTHAYDLARQSYIAEGNNRVILATDGDFNVGVSSDAELGKLIESHRDDGIYLTVLGFGMDNYKDAKMKMLADKGQGNQYYIDNMPEAEKVFSTQLTSTLFAIANDVKVQVEFNPYNVREYRLIGYESRMLNKEDFNDDSKDAGEMGAGHQVTALYEIVPANGEPEPPPVDALKYQDEEAREAAAPRHTDEAFTVKIRYKNPSGGDKSSLITHVQGQSDEGFDRGSDNLRWAAVMTEFGMSLRNSKFRGSATFGEALKLARALHTDDPNGDRAEFLRLLKTCELLAHEREE
jgi:Ca-activated chloride channel family protein